MPLLRRGALPLSSNAHDSLPGAARDAWLKSTSHLVASSHEGFASLGSVLSRVGRVETMSIIIDIFYEVTFSMPLVHEGVACERM